jgi:hypothetical protein
VDPEKLTDRELAQAMDDLGIEKQEVSDADEEVSDTIRSGGCRWLVAFRPGAAGQRSARTHRGPSGAHRCV